jgi:hypothetical protein
MYCLFCVFLYIVCVYMCTELLPTGGYPIAVKYISYHKHVGKFSLFCFYCFATCCNIRLETRLLYYASKRIRHFSACVTQVFYKHSQMLLFPLNVRVPVDIHKICYKVHHYWCALIMNGGSKLIHWFDQLSFSFCFVFWTWPTRRHRENNFLTIM